MQSAALRELDIVAEDAGRCDRESLRERGNGLEECDIWLAGRCAEALDSTQKPPHCRREVTHACFRSQPCSSASGHASRVK
jgi:hypothetical protein